MDQKIALQTRAPLRWAGSKRKSIPALRNLLPAEYTKYIEPFAGSACLAFAIEPRTAVLGDINPQLIEFYHHLKSDPNRLYQAYATLTADSSTYYGVRKRYNQSGPCIDRAAQFLYLNRLCFNGIYRVNRAGEFNVPWGGDKVGRPLSLQDLENASRALQSATFECADFETVVEAHIEAGHFFYLDPPYARDEARVFREYHEKSFATPDWGRLQALLAKIDAAGAHFLLSYAGDDSLLSELGRWNVGHIEVTRNVGGFRASRRKYREFTATNYKCHL